MALRTTTNRVLFHPPGTSSTALASPQGRARPTRRSERVEPGERLPRHVGRVPQIALTRRSIRTGRTSGRSGQLERIHARVQRIPNWPTIGDFRQLHQQQPVLIPPSWPHAYSQLKNRIASREATAPHTARTIMYSAEGQRPMLQSVNPCTAAPLGV